ncbi:MAG: hypothetical protein DDT19_00883 [Syntrophomonadaceae bacterium]|nr:hypothetical protein [Bacillota bacterium]
MIDREVNIHDGKDVAEYTKEAEETTKMKKEMRNAGKKVKGGYVMTASQLRSMLIERKK